MKTRGWRRGAHARNSGRSAERAPLRKGAVASAKCSTLAHRAAVHTFHLPLPSAPYRQPPLDKQSPSRVYRTPYSSACPQVRDSEGSTLVAAHRHAKSRTTAIHTGRPVP